MLFRSYAEEELNQLHIEKRKNEAQANKLYNERATSMKRQHHLDTQKKASKTGNKLTQYIDEQGNTISSAEHPELIPEKLRHLYYIPKEKQIELLNRETKKGREGGEADETNN